MTVIFRSTPVNVPFTFDSIGNHWDQPPVIPSQRLSAATTICRRETGCGRVRDLCGDFSPSRRRRSPSFPPLSATATRRKATAGAPALPLLPARWKAASRTIVGSRPAVKVEPEQGQKIAELITRCVSLYSAGQDNKEALSVNCYRLLLSWQTRRTLTILRIRRSTSGMWRL